MSDTTTDIDHDEPAIQPPANDAAPDEGATYDDGPVYRRTMSESTRRLFTNAAKALAPQLADGADDEMPAIPPPDEQPAAAAAPPTQAPPPAAEATPAAAAAPAIAAATDRRGLELDVRARALEEREAKLAEREQAASRYADARDRYAEDPFGFLKELVKEWSGAASDEELRDEMADIVTSLSERGLGMPVAEDVKNRTEARRALRVAKSYKDQARRDAEAAQRRATEEAAVKEQRQREVMAVEGIGKTLALPEHAAKFPHLLLEDDPGAIVWDVIKEQQKEHVRAGNAPDTFVADWTKAAQLADNHFRAQHAKLREKLNRLPTPAAQAPASGASNQGAAQGRAARTLTNAVASPLPPTTTVDDDEAPYDREAARNRSRAKLRAALKERTT